MDWQLQISLHWPHDRFAIGWEYIGPCSKENISTYKWYFTIITVSFNIFHGD